MSSVKIILHYNKDSHFIHKKEHRFCSEERFYFSYQSDICKVISDWMRGRNEDQELKGKKEGKAIREGDKPYEALDSGK